MKMVQCRNFGQKRLDSEPNCRFTQTSQMHLSGVLRLVPGSNTRPRDQSKMTSDPLPRLAGCRLETAPAGRGVFQKGRFAMARVFQDTRQKSELGAKAPWHVEWRVNGKRFSRKVGPKMQALEVARQVEREQIDGEFGLPCKKTWEEFRQEYEATILPGMRSELSRVEAKRCLKRFHEVCKPVMVRGIDRRMLDEYVAKRRNDRGKKKGEVVSAETIRKELRTIRAALSQAHQWGWLRTVP